MFLPPPLRGVPFHNMNIYRHFKSRIKYSWLYRLCTQLIISLMESTQIALVEGIMCLENYINVYLLKGSIIEDAFKAPLV